MNPEEKEKSTEKDFGKVIDALHNKAKLSSLRTYQGDVAEFIKSKDESVISIALKEKEKREKKAEEELAMPQTPASQPDKRGLQINLTIILSSLALLAGGLYGFFFIFEALDEPLVNPVILEEKIIPYNHLITLANVTDGNFGAELARVSPSSGISVLRISGQDGLLIQTSQGLLDFLKVSPPAALIRALKDEYVIGIISQGEKPTYFIILTVNDFGKAFSAMLDWEESVLDDMAFLNVEPASVPATDSNLAAATSTTTGTGTTTTVKADILPPMKEVFSWKDIIIKNKDTRALATDKNKAKIAYAFLDKNTILITNSLPAIGEISAAYASRSVVR